MADDLVSKDLDFEMTNAYKYFGKEKSPFKGKPDNTLKIAGEFII
jgi:hypothetical protein